LENDVIVPIAHCLVDYGLPRDPGDWLFTRGINVRYDDEIRIAKRAPKLFLELLRARIAMRLKHAEDALPPGILCCRQRRANLARMMPVIVDDHEPLAAVLDFKSAPGSPEGFERLGDLRKGDAEFRGKRNDGHGVRDIVQAGDIQRDCTQGFGAAQHAKARLEIARVEIIEAIPGHRGNCRSSPH
jgi:hypothetical protein